MNLISNSLTVLTQPNYWSFSHLHIYFGGTLFLQVFGLLWSMKWRGPWSSANTKKDEGQSPKGGLKPMLIRSPFMHIHPPREPKGPSPQRWDQDTSGLSKANEDLRKDSLSYPFLEDISKITTSKGVQLWRTETLEDARSLHAKDETEASPKRGRPAGLGLWGRPA